ncbi:hypothetical protein GCM10009549_35210 [Streptomyces thermoalcalitolerans]|uniref:Uncharacterized protein n=1 Tax=Streptomyces thermoalcalitolerans TaxID=65605 RepID=A0ABN1NWB3_9ACTN
MVEVHRPGQLGDRDLARVGEAGVDLVAHRGRAPAEHPVLGVQHGPGVRRQVLGDAGRPADAEVDTGTGRDVAGAAGCTISVA